MPTPQPRPRQTPLVSEFATDPDMRELVEAFVQELPQRVDAIRAAWSGQQLDTLQRLAHQLRGASAGYGFPAVGDAAGALERQLTTLCAAGPAPDLSTAAREVEALVDLCSRVRVA